jgi:signal transduction histidine kinase
MQIRQKLTLSFSIIAMLAAAVGLLSINISKKILQEEIAKSASVLAADLLKDIDRHIYARIETVQEHCKDITTIQAIAGSNRRFEKMSNVQSYIHQQDSKWTSAPQGETTELMQKLLNSDLSNEMRKDIEFYEEKYGYPVFVETIATNKYGVNVAQTQRSSDYYQADEQWWQQAKEKGRYIGDVQYDDSAEIYSIAICVKVLDEAGEFIGVVKSVLNIEDAYAFFEEEMPICFKLLNKENRVIYSTDEEHVFFEDLTGRAPYDVLLSEKNDSHIIADNGIHQDHAELIEYVHSTGFKDYEGLGWVLVVEHDVEELFASVSKLKDLILLVSSVVTAISLGLGVFLSKSISVPITKLAEAAKNIGKGNLNSHVEIDSNDETKLLAESFNRMIEDMKTTTTSIDDLNAVNQQLRASQQQLERSNAQLNSEVAGRRRIQKNMTFVNSELEIVVEKLKQSNQDLQDFVYIASHDLREPLRKISSFGQLLEDSLGDRLEEDDKENLDFMVDGAGRMTEMIESLLIYSRLNTKKIVLDTVDLNEMIEQFRQLELAMLLEEKNGVIEVPLRLPKVMADTALVRQVVQNLIANGIKYQEEGASPQVVVTTREIEDGKVRIEVADNGIGIKEELHEAIFKMFKRVHTRQKYEGTGIGLAVCKKIVERHGGQIGIESKEGQGSMFWFTLEMAKETALIS